MLANGAKLEFKSKTVTTFTKLKGLKELPEIGVEPEKVENSDLDDTQKVYEMGIGDPGDITYKFKYDNTETDSPYRVLRKYEESGEKLSFKEKIDVLAELFLVLEHDELLPDSVDGYEITGRIIKY